MAKTKKRRKASAFVLDSSVALAWCFHDEANAYADAVAARFPEVIGTVPVIWHLEIANALLMGERRKRSTESNTAQWLGQLSGLPIVTDEDGLAHTWTGVISLARAQNLTAYDASYLELAMRRGLPLASLDNRLKAAAKALGIAEFKP
jgi:predicted nucleic acid-binding protein